MHAHSDPHERIEAGTRGAGYYEIMEIAVRELLVEKQLIGAGEIRRQIEVLDSRTPALGAKVIARAWVDPEFRARLLANGRKACEELGISFYDETELIVLENTVRVHNLVVCTLCSCYPRPVLGLPPDWYKLKPYRARAVREPRALLAEFGTVIPDEVEIRVSDSTAMVRYLVLPYGLGLRHAVDADHIAAIDNVTRKLMQENKRPVSVGFFFAMGHSAVVILVAAAIAVAATMLDRIESFREIGGFISTSTSALFLVAIAVMNVVIFVSIYKCYRRVRAGGPYVEADFDVLLNNRGFLSRMLRPVFRLITKSWHMLLLGLLFGLGFDTATEIALFGLSAAQVANGVAFGTILVFPALFAAGMSLVDTTDGVMMLGAYEWAFVEPIRKLYYNMTVTLVSAVVALFVGGIEALGLIADRFELAGGLWDAVGVLNGNVKDLGFVIIGIFLAAWGFSYLIYRFKNLDNAKVRVAGRAYPSLGRRSLTSGS